MKILVVGFQRGGTTLLNRLINFHPDVVKNFHEKRFLLHYLTKEKLFTYLQTQNIDPNKDNWGDKVPFYPSVFPGGAKSYINYCKKWLKLGEDTRIIYITRHPIDIAISTKKFNWCKNLEEVIKYYSDFTIPSLEQFQQLKKGMIISFETLVTYPNDSLSEIYSFCNLNSSPDLIHKILNTKTANWGKHQNYVDGSRAFAYKKFKNLQINCKIPKYSEIRKMESLYKKGV